MAKDNNKYMPPWWLLVIILIMPSGTFLIYAIMKWGGVQNMPLLEWFIAPAVGVGVTVILHFKSHQDKHR